MFEQLRLSMELLPSAVAAAILLALAFWLLWFDFETRVHRAFALLLILKAFFLGLLSLGTGVDDLASLLRMYFAIGTPFAAIYFTLVLRSHLVRLRRPPLGLPLGVWAVVLSLAASVFLLLFAFRRDLYRTADGVEGPLVLFLPLAYAAFALISFLLLRFARSEDGSRRKGLLIVALAFSLEPLHMAAYQVASIPLWLSLGWYALADLIRVPFFGLSRFVWIATGALLVAAWFVLRDFLRSDDAAIRRRARWISLAGLLPILTGLLSNLVTLSDRFLGTRLFVDIHFAMNAIWVVAGAVLIVYAILHHHFLDRPRRLRRVVRTSTVVGASLILFFFAQELLEEVLQGRFPPLPGLAAAVVAAVLVYPVMMAITRFIRAVMPAARPLDELRLDERRAIYASQVELVWMDGVVTKVERRLLERMRERLQLPEDVARHIEESVLADMRGPPPDPAIPASEGGRPRVPS